MNRISIRLRITIMIILMLIICCIGLTGITNFAAHRMASEVALVTTPAFEVSESQNINLIDASTIVSGATASDEDVQKIINDFYFKSILAMIGIICIGGIGGYYITSRALNPLTKLNKQIQNMTATDLSINLDVPPSKDEIADLTKSFNDMTDKLNETFTFQKQFSANIAHELRTPLTILKAKIEVFHKKNTNSNEDYEQLISILEKQIIRLSETIQNLLNITSENKILEKEIISVSDIIDDVIEKLSLTAQSKNIHFKTNYNNTTIYGNIDLLYQVFYNLIENSIKYNEINGKVEIIAEQYDKENSIIKIIDTGIGIPIEMQKDIFEPFCRADKSNSCKIEGKGLGLSIAKNIIEKHNGKIIVSNNVTKGCCFSVVLPKKRQR